MNKFEAFLSPCSIPVQIGHGMGHIKRIYYNAALKQCIPFIYSGMGGNENNFLTIQECTIKCLNDESNVIRYFDVGKFFACSHKNALYVEIDMIHCMTSCDTTRLYKKSVLFYLQRSFIEI